MKDMKNDSGIRKTFAKFNIQSIILSVLMTLSLVTVTVMGFLPVSYTHLDVYKRQEHDSDEVNPRMNKIMKILTIVVAVLILVVLGVVVGKATGVLKFNKGILALRCV